MDSPLKAKPYSFALRIIKASQHLTKQGTAYPLINQLLKSGTSIGANVEEAFGSQSQADFIAKLSIAYKETRETIYWISLLRDSQELTPNAAQSLLNNAEELSKIIYTAKKTAQTKLK